MVREIDPERSRRAAAFALWSRAPMPMVTLMKTLDVTLPGPAQPPARV